MIYRDPWNFLKRRACIEIRITFNAYQGDAMQSNTQAQETEFRLSCEEFARLNQIKPQSVRARLCRFGSYYGIKPVKLVNGRLAFPAVQVTQ